MDGGTQQHQARDPSWSLVERLKELNCLYAISRLLDRVELGLPAILQLTVELIPRAWQHADVACARICLFDQHYCSADFSRTEWRQECPVIARAAPVGSLEVCYREARPPEDEGPFLLEERNLLNALAQRLGEITERKQAEEELHGYQERLRHLAYELVRTEERERRQIATQLHDGIAQLLAISKIKLELLLRRDCTTPTTAEPLREVLELIGQAIAATRTLQFEISPPILDEFGLEAALEWVLERLHDRHHLQVELQRRGRSQRLPQDLRYTLFRATRELLANVVKHARARTVRVEVTWSPGHITIRVADDGIGCGPDQQPHSPAPEGGFGLFSIRERLTHLGGQLTLTSRPGQGTVALLQLPLPPLGAEGEGDDDDDPRPAG